MRTDVFVVGGGPAGLAAAIAARRRGLEVTLADGLEPSIDKPCGEGMIPETLTALRDLGVEVPAGEGCAFRGISFLTKNAQVAAPFPEGQGIGIRRPILHGLLLAQAEKAGVKFLWKTPVRGIFGDGVQVHAGTILARWVVGADGSGSRVRRWSQLECARYRRTRIATRRHYRVRPWSEYMEIHWAPRSQAYVTPVSPDEVCIVVLAERMENANFASTLAELPELRQRLAGAEISSRERGAITAMHSLRRVTRDNVALVGDASGGVDAITGEGLGLTFRQAAALADAMATGELSRYEQFHRRLARRPLWMGSIVLQLGRNQWLRDRAMAVLQHRPQLFEKMLAIHVGQGTPRDLVTTSAQFGWDFLAA